MKVSFKQIIRVCVAPVAAVVIAFSYVWDAAPPRPDYLKGVGITVLWASFIFIGYWLFKKGVAWGLTRTQRHPFWKTEFLQMMDELFLVTSLFFPVLFIENEIANVGYTAVILIILFWRTHSAIARHPDATHWLHVHRTAFLLIAFLFILQAGFQYTAYHYYLLENHQQHVHTVLLRTLTMTSAWVFLFSLASLLYAPQRKRIHSLGLIAWGVLFVGIVILWIVNIGILYFSGIYLNPVVFDHAQGAADVVENGFLGVFIAILLVICVLFFVLMRELYRAHRTTPKRYWSFYNGALLLSSAVFLIGFATVQQTPEAVIARSFWQRIRGTENVVTLPDGLQKKLEKFGLRYDTTSFSVSDHDTVFTTEKQLLPERFATQQPNILLIFVESFSSRFSNTYSSAFPDISPGFDAMAQHEDTTIVRNYYNASTPTMTGIISALCSFLPPTGHGEISQQKKYQTLRLSCLPQLLKDANYQKTAYITSVGKEYSNKESVFSSMGVEDIYGSDELSAFIQGDPLSWGYSDHQVMPIVLPLLQQQPQPFFFTYSTIDSHPPFNISKDATPYKDGSNPVLNMFHSTDDAFKQFWEEFQKSELAKNTIVIVTGDHAVFPSTPVQNTFPEEKADLSFYDEMPLFIYVPETVLPKEVDLYSSGIDLTPTLLHMLNINVPNSFEGHSIFDDRDKYPNLLGMHELGLYINQKKGKTDERKIDYTVPAQIRCRDINYYIENTTQLTTCEMLYFYNWKRSMLQQGRLWYNE